MLLRAGGADMRVGGRTYPIVLKTILTICGCLLAVEPYQGASSLSLSPGSVTLGPSQSQLFQVRNGGGSKTVYVWSLSPAVGKISSNGLYLSPASITAVQTVTVSATNAADSTQSASATVTLTPGVAVTIAPSTVSLGPAQSQQFTATVTGAPNTAVVWKLSSPVGTISASGRYNAPSSITSTQTIQVTATSSADSTKSASAVVNLVPPVTVSVTPPPASLTNSQSRQFTATV